MLRALDPGAMASEARGMLSVVIVASEDLPCLAAQMAMLVPAAVDGLVKEVILVAGE